MRATDMNESNLQAFLVGTSIVLSIVGSPGASILLLVLASTWMLSKGGMRFENDLHQYIFIICVILQARDVHSSDYLPTLLGPWLIGTLLTMQALQRHHDLRLGKNLLEFAVISVWISSSMYLILAEMEGWMMGTILIMTPLIMTRSEFKEFHRNPILITSCIFGLQGTRFLLWLDVRNGSMAEIMLAHSTWIVVFTGILVGVLVYSIVGNLIEDEAHEDE
tara:strand:+ start:1075 stop:1737 length:663 start_codon:yes stop_codon:yes gene_type:complete